jgi:hypothetical protein
MIIYQQKNRQIPLCFLAQANHLAALFNFGRPLHGLDGLFQICIGKLALPGGHDGRGVPKEPLNTIQWVLLAFGNHSGTTIIKCGHY